MAFDIVRTGRSVPGQGPGATANVDLSTGGQLVARAIGQAGEAVSGAAETLHRLEADNEFSEWDRQKSEILATLDDRMRREPNSKLYAGMASEALGEIQNIPVENGLARRKVGFRMDALRGAMPGVLLARRYATEKDVYRGGILADITAGDYGKAQLAIDEGEKNGYLGDEEAQLLRNRVTSYQTDAKQQASENAEFERLKVKAEADAMRDVETIPNKETRTNVRTRLKGHFGSEDLREEKAKEKAEEDLYALAQTGDFETYQKTVEASPGFSPDEKGALLRKYNERLDSIRQGKADPFKFRKNHRLYWDLYQRAESGEDVRKQARAAVGWDPENPEGTGITETDYKEIKNLILDPIQEQDPVLKSAIQAIDRRRTAMAGTLTKPDKKKDLPAYRENLANIEMEALRAKQSLTNWFRDNPDATPAQKNQQIDAVLKGSREEGVEKIAERMGVVDKARMAARAPFLKDIPLIKPPEQKPFTPPPKARFFYWEKLDEGSRKQLLQLEAEGDPDKLQRAYEIMKEKYGPVQ